MEPTPIETLFEQQEKGKALAAQGNKITDYFQLMRWGYDSIKAKGLFHKDCERWCKKTLTDKTWTNFKKFFTMAEDDRKKYGPTFCNGEKHFEVCQCFVGEGFLAPTFAVFVKKTCCFDVIVAPAHELRVIDDRWSHCIGLLRLYLSLVTQRDFSTIYILRVSIQVFYHRIIDALL